MLELTVGLEKARERLIEEIHAAFAGVSRTGGVSWGESFVHDLYGNPGNLPGAFPDSDKNWTELVHEPEWDPSPGVGGFSFMDPIGFRYYLPAAMIRCLMSGIDEGIQFHLTLEAPNPKVPFSRDTRPYNLEQWSALDQRQRSCVRDFLQLMVRLSRYQDEDDPCSSGFDTKEWQETLDSYWSGIE